MHKEKALTLFGQGYLCSQAVLAAFAEECGLTEKQALMLGACFGRGMRKGEVCGACTGALMVLGSLYGQYDKTDPDSREISNTVNDKMMERFAAVSGSCLCNDLLGCDVSTEEGVKYAREHDLFTEFCPQMVANAVDILEQIIQEQPQNSKQVIHIMTYCGENCCEECDRLSACGGCERCQGHPFGGSCVAERNEDFPSLKRRLIDEINAFGIEGLAVSDLNLLTGSYVNLSYPLAGGSAARFLKDNDIYLGNQVGSSEPDRWYGIAANEDFILICEYGRNGSDPEIVLYKRR